MMELWSVADIGEVRLKVWHGLPRHESNIHSLDVVLYGVELAEVKPTHGVECLIVRGSIDSDRYLDQTLFLLFIRLGASHVDNGVSFNVLLGQAPFGYSLDLVGVDRTAGRTSSANQS
jgi:hypothetical protein